MTFEEWVTATKNMTEHEKALVDFTWNAATEVEREACAKICVNRHQDSNSDTNEAIACANLIRRRRRTL